MSKYRKKPIVIDAWWWNPDNPSSLPAILEQLHSRGMEFREYDDKLFILTLEGQMMARPGDWIIQGVNGEFYPCKDDIFEKTYEPVL